MKNNMSTTSKFIWIFYKLKKSEIFVKVKNNFFNKNLLWTSLWGTLIFIYGLLIWETLNRFLSNFSANFGYLDIQENWRALDNFVKNQVFFRDYFYQYGYFLLFLQSFPYKFFGESFFGVIVARHLFLPVFGVGLVYLIGRNVFKEKKYIFLFLYFNLFFGSTLDFSPVRHLVAELSLSFFLLYILRPKSIYILLSGLIGGIAFITALEYGIALNISIMISFVLTIFMGVKNKKSFFIFLVAQSFVLIPYGLYLYLNNALKNYFEFTLGFMNNFYFASPCNSDSFPRVSDIKELASRSNWLIYGIPVEFLQNLNLYIIPVFYLVVLLVLSFRNLINKKFERKDLIKLCLIIYGLLVYIRTLDTPCIGYFRYGLIPFFLLITLIISDLVDWSKIQRSIWRKVVVFFGLIIIFFWFTITDNTGIIQTYFAKKDPVIKEIKSIVLLKNNSKIGWSMEEKIVEKYEKIVDYLKKNFVEQDKMFVYPWGPFNNMSGHMSADTIANSIASTGGEQFIKKTIEEFELDKPRIVVISLKNSGGVAHYGKTREDLGLPGRYYSLGYKDGPVFAGRGNDIEKYILSHYDSVYNNSVGIIMKRRDKSLLLENNFIKTALVNKWNTDDIDLFAMIPEQGVHKYTVTGQDSYWQMNFNPPIKASDFEIKYKVDGDFITKRLSRYAVQIFVEATNVDKNLPYGQIIARKEWQNTWISLGGIEEIKSIKIKMAKNNGLIWWLHPYLVELDNITFYNWDKFLEK